MAGRFGWFKRAMVRRALTSVHARRAMSRGPAHKLWAWLWADRDIVLDAVRHHGCHLQYASSELRADREVVLAAVAKSGHALEYASDALRADREVVLTAIEHHASYLKFASNELRCRIVSCWLWSSIVPQCSNIRSMLQHVPAELQADVRVADLLRIANTYPAIPCGRKYSAYSQVHTLLCVDCINKWDKCSLDKCSHIAMKCSLARDRDALGAAVGARTLPAPHAALNGAPEALALVHCLVARRVEAMAAEIDRHTMEACSTPWISCRLAV